jgi:hypothetical protein
MSAREQELEAEIAELRQRLRFHDEFLSTLRAACLKAQGIEKDRPLDKRAATDRGFRADGGLLLIFEKE